MKVTTKCYCKSELTRVRFYATREIREKLVFYRKSDLVTSTNS